LFSRENAHRNLKKQLDKQQRILICENIDDYVLYLFLSQSKAFTIPCEFCEKLISSTEYDRHTVKPRSFLYLYVSIFAYIVETMQ